jgi:predicted metal-dependent hydrolase
MIVVHELAHLKEKDHDKAFYQLKGRNTDFGLGLQVAALHPRNGSMQTQRVLHYLNLLRMIVVHELAHLKEKDHDKAFYQLCCHMEPDYHQLL